MKLTMGSRTVIIQVPLGEPHVGVTVVKVSVPCAGFGYSEFTQGSQTLLFQWLPCLTLGIIGIVLKDRLVGLVVRRPPRERRIPGSNPACAGIFSGSSHTSDSKIGTPVAALPGAWRYRVSAGTGRLGVSIL